jgi:hypothetical protein
MFRSENLTADYNRAVNEEENLWYLRNLRAESSSLPELCID